MRILPTILVFLVLGNLAGAAENSARWAQLVSNQPADSTSSLQPARERVNPCPELESLGYRFRRLDEIQTDIRIEDRVTPQDCSVGLFREGGPADFERHQVATEFAWAPSELYHQPLYFEDAILERYGQTPHPLVQPWISGARFFGTFPLMPYYMGLSHPYDHVSVLGYYRPGSPTPCLRYHLPLEADAAIVEAATWVSLFFILP